MLVLHTGVMMLRSRACMIACMYALSCEQGADKGAAASRFRLEMGHAGEQALPSGLSFSSAIL